VIKPLNYPAYGLQTSDLGIGCSGIHLHVPEKWRVFPAPELIQIKISTGGTAEAGGMEAPDAQAPTGAEDRAAGACGRPGLASVAFRARIGGADA
jgi:hypothetical protein